MRSPVVLVVAVFATPIICVADSPVLDYSARLGGSGQHRVAGVAIDSDGSIYIAGTTNSTDFPTTQQAPYPPSESLLFPYLLPYIFVTRLSPDGASIMCSMVLGGGYNDSLSAMALGSDGIVNLLGYTSSSDFPITVGSAPTGGSTFLMRLNPCTGKILFSTVLILGVAATGQALAVDRSGNAVIALSSLDGKLPADAAQIDPLGNGLILLVAPDGRRLASARVPGEPSSVAISPDGSVYVAGRASGLFAARLDPGLQSAVYVLRLLGGVVANAITVDSTGNAYITGGGSGLPVTSDAAFSSPLSSGGILLKLDPAGAVLYASYTEGPSLAPNFGSRSGVGIALDPTGKIYVATVGTYFLPEIGPVNDRARFSGVRIRVFAPDGSLEDGDLLVPSNRSFASLPFVFGFDGERHVVVATAQSAAPVTQGSLSTNAPHPCRL